MSKRGITADGWIGLAQLALKSTPIEKYLYLSTLRKNNVHLFYRLVVDHLKVGGRSFLFRVRGSRILTCAGIDPLDLHPRRG